LALSTGTEKRSLVCESFERSRNGITTASSAADRAGGNDGLSACASAR
jgi:hypothetical protein